MKKILLVVFIICLLISGCRSAGNGGKTVITFWHVMGGPSGEALIEIVDSFNVSNPDIKVELISVGTYEALSTKLMSSMSQPPVMSQVYESWTSEFYQAGLLVPIEDLLNQSEKDEIKTDVYEIFVKDNTFNGKLVTMPFNKSVPAYFYNKEMFTKYNIQAFPKTWNEFLSCMKSLTIDIDKNGEYDIHGTAFNINVWMFECRLLQYGGILTDENMNPMFVSEAGIKAIDIDRQMVKKDMSAYVTTGYQHQDDFLSGKVSTIYGSCVSLSFIMESKPQFTLGIAPVPSGDKDAVFISGTNVAIFNKCTKEQQNAAFKFVKFFTSSKMQALWAYRTGYLPIRRSSMNDDLIKKQFNDFPGLSEVYAQLEYANMEPQNKEWYIGRKLLGNALEYSIKGDYTPKKALEEAARDFKKEIKNNDGR